MNDMNNTNNTNSENEQVQNSFSTADNSQTDTSANASGYNAGSSYTSSYDAQQNAYNSYYNYANGANNTGANNTGANNIHVAPGANKPPKKNGKGALVAGIIAAALVVGGDKDLFVPVEVTKAMCDAIPGAKLYMAPNGGHVQHWEQLEKYNQVTLDFLLEQIK